LCLAPTALADTSTTAGDVYTVVPADGYQYLHSPQGVAVDAGGNVYVDDAAANDVKKLLPGVTCTTSLAPASCYTIVAGGGTPATSTSAWTTDGPAGFSGDGGPATQAALNNPLGIAFDPQGDLYIYDTGNYRIRMVPAADGTYFGQPMSANDIYTIAGNGTPGDGGDGGPATDAQVDIGETLTVGSDGSVYFSDLVSGCVRKIAPDDVISSFACGLSGPLGLAFDPGGNLYVSTVGDNRVSRITPAGEASRFAGTGAAGYSGDGGPATDAQLDVPHGVAVAPNGDVLISDRANCVIRAVSPDGTISTYAGDHHANAVGVGRGCAYGGYSGDGGPATSAAARLAYPEALAESPSGDLYIVDTGSDAVRAVIGEQTPVANEAPPAIAGNASVGQTLSATPGEWAGTPFPSLAYQWCTSGDAGSQGDCPSGYSTIADATGPTYALSPNDSGHALTVVVSAANALGGTTANAAPTPTVDGGP
jgi:sugar lactone lactonase YvrE